MFNEKMRPEVAIKGEDTISNILTENEQVAHPIKGFQIREFFLQNNKTFVISYFTSLFYYEPHVTDMYMSNPVEDLDLAEYHIFHSFFPKRKIYFYPKMIVLQSTKPYFSFHKSFLEFYFTLVIKPYLTCTKPFKLKVASSKFRNSNQDHSVVKHKEFFLSFLFSCKINRSSPVVKLMKFADFQFEIGNLYYDKYYLEKSNYHMFLRLFETKANARKLAILYFYLVMERKVIIVHDKTSEFLQFLFNILRPL